MPAIQDDVTSRYFGTLLVGGFGQTFSEHYDMKPTASWDEVVAKFRVIALFRAAILGRGASVRYAVVSEQGPARKSRIVVQSPVLGTTGVHFSGSGLGVAGVLCNTLATGVRLRFETQVGDHYTRLVRGVCDAWVSQRQWQPTSLVPDAFVVGDFGTVFMDGPNPAVPGTVLYDFSRTYTTAQLRAFYGYELAWQRYISAVFNYTDYKRPNINSQGVRVDNTFTKVPWFNVAYRGISDRNPGRPTDR